MEKVKKMLPKFCGFLFFGMMGTFVSAQKISYQVNSQTGALQTLSIANDPQKMNWLVATDIGGSRRIMDGDWDMQPK